MAESFGILLFTLLGSITLYLSIPQRKTAFAQMQERDELSARARRLSRTYQLLVAVTLSTLAFSWVWHAAHTLQFEF
jgi:hypothetical protein